MRLSQQDLAVRAGVSPRTVGAYETGRVPRRRPSTWPRLAAALGWDASSYERILDGGQPLLLTERSRITELPTPSHLRALVHSQSDADVDATLVHLAELIRVVSQERSDRSAP